MNRLAWIDALRTLAAPPLAGTPLAHLAESPSDAQTDHHGPDPAPIQGFIDGFADEMGHRRRVDRPLLAWLLGVSPGDPPERPAPDEALWWALHESGSDPRGLLRAESGPLLGADSDLGIEVSTEQELAALHAAWWLTRRDSDAQLRDRIRSAAEWHVRTLQPDNATNHPWAVHVFLDLAANGGAQAIDAEMHARTLVHNSMMMQGRPGRFAACLLLDAARALEAHDHNQPRG